MKKQGLPQQFLDALGKHQAADFGITRSTVSRAAITFRPCLTSSHSASPLHKARALSRRRSLRLIEVLP
jgi:hypothetical protein